MSHLISFVPDDALPEGHDFVFVDLPAGAHIFYRESKVTTENPRATSGSTNAMRAVGSARSAWAGRSVPRAIDGSMRHRRCRLGAQRNRVSERCQGVLDARHLRGALQQRAGAVVVQGSRAITSGFGKESGLSIYAPIIASARARIVLTKSGCAFASRSSTRRSFNSAL